MFDFFNNNAKQQKNFQFETNLGRCFSFGIYFNCKFSIKEFIDKVINKISVLPLSEKDICRLIEKDNITFSEIKNFCEGLKKNNKAVIVVQNKTIVKELKDLYSLKKENVHFNKTINKIGFLKKCNTFTVDTGFGFTSSYFNYYKAIEVVKMIHDYIDEAKKTTTSHYLTYDDVFGRNMKGSGTVVDFNQTKQPALIDGIKKEQPEPLV